MSVQRTDTEIEAQLAATDEPRESGRSRYPGLSYEEGVDAALRWAMGWSDDAPMEDE